MDFTDTRLIPLVDEGLGNSAYLVDLGDGRALAVDPSRDLRMLRAAADRRGLRVAFAADTHLHADFLTGAPQLAADEGAQVLASATGHREYRHRGLVDGDGVDMGGLLLRVLSTPGHTDEHLSYVLLDGSSPLGVFTGGSLIVGAAARTDLVDPGRTRELAHAQYRSLRRLTELPDPTPVWPTHGAGSFCSAPPGARRTTTIGAEKRTNPLLAVPDADTFADRLIESLGSFPPYFLRLPEQNRTGPAVLAREPVLELLDLGSARSALAEGAIAVDVRPVAAFTAGHVPGAISIPLRDQFATWLGWLTVPETPVIVIRESDQDVTELLWQALKIGFERILGELPLAVWHENGGELATLPLLRPDQVAAARPVLDVRQDSEYAIGHLPAATHIELGELPRLAADIERRPYVVMCGHGERAATAASLLARTGHRGIAVLRGGPGDWAKATGKALAGG